MILKNVLILLSNERLYNTLFLNSINNLSALLSFNHSSYFHLKGKTFHHCQIINIMNEIVISKRKKRDERDRVSERVSK